MIASTPSSQELLDQHNVYPHHPSQENIFTSHNSSDFKTSVFSDETCLHIILLFMMEAAGLALVFLPLVVSALARRKACVAALKRLCNPVGDAERILIIFDVQTNIFHSHCRQLLKPFLLKDQRQRLDEMFENFADPAWKNPTIEARLAKGLGDKNQTYQNIIKLINQQLEKVHLDVQELESTLAKEEMSQRGNANDQIWTRRISQRANISLSKLPRLERAIDELRKLNTDFQMLSAPLYENLKALHGKKRQRSVPQYTEELEKFNAVRKTSRLFHEALSQASAVNSKHPAHFCVQVERPALDKSQTAAIKYRMVIRCVHKAEPRTMWLSVESILEELKTLKRQNEAVAEQIRGHVAKKTLNSVAFEYSEADSASTTLATAQIKNLAIDCSAKQNICEFLYPGSQNASAEHMILKIIEDSTVCVHVIRPLMPPCSQPLQATSLQQLINLSDGRPRLEHFFLSERIRLAKILAIGVLQYYSTPLLSKPWGSEDVLFLGLENETNDVQSLTPPHVYAPINSFSDPTAEDSNSLLLAAITGNPLLFSLGVIFLEIAFMCPWRGLRRESDVGKSSDQRLTDFWHIERLAHSGCTGMGPRFDTIIRKLVACDFGFGNDLAKPQLQNAIYDGVIAPLEALEREMRDRFDT